MTNITVSNHWRNTLKIKHLFTSGDTTPELTAMLCTSIVKQLISIRSREATGNLTYDSKCEVDNKLEEVIDHFGFLLDLAHGAILDNASEGRITEDEWIDYDFDGNFQQWFNDYMTELYDLSDERFDTIHSVREKFIWIE